MMQIVRVGAIPPEIITAVRDLGATAVNADHVPVLYVHADQGERFRGCHVYDRQTGRNMIVINADLQGEELHQTLLHEAWHCYNGDGMSTEPESVIEARCCRMTGT